MADPLKSSFVGAALLDVAKADSYRENGAIKKADEAQLTFDELKEIEAERRKILLRAELPFWRILLFWSGTCLKEISTDLLVWLTLGIYVGIRIYANLLEDVPDAVSLLEKTNIGVLGGFLSFFLVLFVNQTNQRFLEMYGFSKAASGRIQDLAGLAKAQLPKEDGLRLVRHLNAAQIAGYVGLNGIGQGSPYSKAHFFGEYNQRYNLLSREEMLLLDHHDMDMGGSCLKELVTWAQEDVSEARRAGHIDSLQEQLMQNKILDFRAAVDGMYDYTDQPPHFFYIHFLCLLSALYLPLFSIDTAYAAGWGDDCFLALDVLNGLIVFLQCIFVVGLRSLGNKMVDPYGDDFEDLSVILYVQSTLDNCDVIMNSMRDESGAKSLKPGPGRLPAVHKVQHFVPPVVPPTISDPEGRQPTETSESLSADYVSNNEENPDGSTNEGNVDGSNNKESDDGFNNHDKDSSLNLGMC